MVVYNKQCLGSINSGTRPHVLGRVDVWIAAFRFEPRGHGSRLWTGVCRTVTVPKLPAFDCCGFLHVSLITSVAHSYTSNRSLYLPGTLTTTTYTTPLSLPHTRSIPTRRFPSIPPERVRKLSTNEQTRLEVQEPRLCTTQELHRLAAQRQQQRTCKYQRDYERRHSRAPSQACERRRYFALEPGCEPHGQPLLLPR